MTIKITLNDREMTVPSEAALEAGWGWYNDFDTTKTDIIEFCAQHGENIVGEDGLLVKDWATIAAVTRANNLPE